MYYIESNSAYGRCSRIRTIYESEYTSACTKFCFVEAYDDQETFCSAFLLSSQVGQWAFDQKLELQNVLDNDISIDTLYLYKNLPVELLFVQ